MTPITCACEKCRAMCSHSTCLPTPDEARALIRAGMGGRLARYEWRGVNNAVGPAPAGAEGRVLDTTATGRRCTFHTEDGRCELHDRGLKPIEGRLAHHDRPWMPIRAEVLKHWAGKRYESVVAALAKG